MEALTATDRWFSQGDVSMPILRLPASQDDIRFSKVVQALATALVGLVV